MLLVLLTCRSSSVGDCLAVVVVLPCCVLELLVGSQLRYHGKIKLLIGTSASAVVLLSQTVKTVAVVRTILVSYWLVKVKLKACGSAQHEQLTSSATCTLIKHTDVLLWRHRTTLSRRVTHSTLS